MAARNLILLGFVYKILHKITTISFFIISITLPDEIVTLIYY